MGTATGLRISSVDGTAFLDNCPADIIAAVGYQVKIYDASNRYLLGWVKEAGSSESLTDIVSGWDFTSGWTTWFGATISDNNTFVTVGANGGVYKYVLIGHQLYKNTFSATASLGVVRATDLAVGDTFFSNGASGAYYTAIHTGGAQASLLIYCNSASSTVDVSTLQVEKVTAPSSSGVTIVNSQGGTTYNFASKDASFTYNAASYTYEIISGHPVIKRFGGVPYAALNRGVF
jgi:hypothetical protein